MLLLYLTASLFIFPVEYSAFAIGGLIQETHTRGKLPMWVGWWCLAFALFFGAMMKGYLARMISPEFEAAIPPILRPGEPHMLWHILAATAMIISVLTIAALKKVLESAPLHFLGRISFGLYLGHVPLIYVLFGGLYLISPGNGDLKLVSLFGLFLPTIIAAGYIFTVTVDEPVLWLLRRTRRRQHA
jgi:peptidoglycan/LPS O-acetylase OafA/YrhL